MNIVCAPYIVTPLVSHIILPQHPMSLSLIGCKRERDPFKLKSAGGRFFSRVFSLCFDIHISNIPTLGSKGRCGDTLRLTSSVTFIPTLGSHKGDTKN